MTRKTFSALAVLFIIFTFFNSARYNKSFAEERGIENKIQVVYFYSKDCPNCRKIEEFVIKIKEKYKNKVDFLKYDVNRIQYGKNRKYENKIENGGKDSYGYNRDIFRDICNVDGIDNIIYFYYGDFRN